MTNNTGWNQIKHFTQQEFDSHDKPGSGSEMDLNFILRLDKLREMVEEPLKINSGFRTEAQNVKVGGVQDSAHTSGKAADITCLTSQLRFKLIIAAINLGFKRIGIGRTFIHLDSCTELPQTVIWLYQD